MFRRFTFFALPMVGVLLLAASAATAADDFLKLVPDSALGFVVINRPAAADAKLQALGRRMQIPMPGLLAMLKQQSGIHEGWDENGSDVLLVLPPEGDNVAPTPILLIPVTDYGKFVGQLKAEDATQPVTKIEIFQKTHWVRKIGGYAALTDESHRESLEKKWTPSKNIATALTSWQKWLRGKDFAAVILRPGVVEASAKAQQGIQVVQAVIAAQSNEQAQAAAGIFDVYAKMFKSAEKDVSAFGFGLELDDEHVVRLTSRTTLISGGFAPENRSSQESLLAGLPAEPFVAAGGVASSAATFEAMMKWSGEMMKSGHKLYGISEEQADKLSAVFTSMHAMKEVRSFSMMLGADAKGGTLLSGAIGIMGVNDATAFMAAYKKDIEKYSEVTSEIGSPMLPPMKIENGRIGDTEALQLTIQLPKAMPGVPAEQQERIMDAFYGPGGKVVAWIAPADEHHVVFGYASKERLQREIEAIRQGKPGVADNAGVAKTAALLPTGPAALAFLSPAETIGFVKRMLPAIVPPEANLKLNLPEFPKTPPIGFAVTTAADEVQTFLVVPPEVLQSIVPYIGQVKARQNGEAPAE